MRTTFLSRSMVDARIFSVSDALNFLARKDLSVRDRREMQNEIARDLHLLRGIFVSTVLALLEKHTWSDIQRKKILNDILSKIETIIFSVSDTLQLLAIPDWTANQRATIRNVAADNSHHIGTSSISDALNLLAIPDWTADERAKIKGAVAENAYWIISSVSDAVTLLAITDLTSEEREKIQKAAAKKAYQIIHSIPDALALLTIATKWGFNQRKKILKPAIKMICSDSDASTLLEITNLAAWQIKNIKKRAVVVNSSTSIFTGDDSKREIIREAQSALKQKH